MKIGDQVCVIGIPDDLPDNDMRTREVFDRCVGRVFSVVGIQVGQLELEVGEVIGEAAYMHSIWIKPEFVAVVKTAI